MYGSKVNTHVKKKLQVWTGFNFLSGVILRGTLFTGSQNTAKAPCSLEAKTIKTNVRRRNTTEYCNVVVMSQHRNTQETTLRYLSAL
jgi:hypothetical protein